MNQALILPFSVGVPDSIPARWRPLYAFLGVLLRPLIDLGTDGFWGVNLGGPDGQRPWTLNQAAFMALRVADPVLEATRLISRLCGTVAGNLDPAPEGQRGAGVYYTVASFYGTRRHDHGVQAVSSLVLDIDAKSVGGEERVNDCVKRVPVPTALVRSGGGVQAVYVLREALVFDRKDDEALLQAVTQYVEVSLGLEKAAGSDEVWTPSHLFRCPATYWLKRGQPILVSLESFEPSRLFNLSDFELYRTPSSERTMDLSLKLHARLLGSPEPSLPLLAMEPPPHDRRMILPRMVSEDIVTLLNTGFSSRYARVDGSLDRSRAVFGACMSLANAGLSDAAIANVIRWSGLRDAVADRGTYSLKWLSSQITRARSRVNEGRG